MAHIIYLMKGADGWPLEPLITENYEYIGEVVHEDLELIFRAMNGVDGSEIEHYLKEFKCRSLSVGDVVHCDHGTFICERMGWKDLHKDPATLAFGQSMEVLECEFCDNIAELGTSYCEECDLKDCRCGERAIPGSAKFCEPCAIDEEACRGDALYDQMKDDRLIP
jgi:hypothetical protein